MSDRLGSTLAALVAGAAIPQYEYGLFPFVGT